MATVEYFTMHFEDPTNVRIGICAVMKIPKVYTPLETLRAIEQVANSYFKRGFIITKIFNGKPDGFDGLNSETH